LPEFAHHPTLHSIHQVKGVITGSAFITREFVPRVTLIKCITRRH
jgi:hypothetical protein